MVQYMYMDNDKDMDMDYLSTGRSIETLPKLHTLFIQYLKKTFLCRPLSWYTYSHSDLLKFDQT